MPALHDVRYGGQAILSRAMFENFNFLFQAARQEHTRWHQIARQGVETVNDMLTCRVWIQAHTPQPQQHADEVLHVAEAFAQDLSKRLDAEFSVTRDGDHEFSLRFTPRPAEQFGEFHPAPAFTGKPSQSDFDAIADHAARNWRTLVSELSGFNDASEATAYAKFHGLEDTTEAVYDRIMQASVKAYRAALLDVADGMEEGDPLLPVIERLDRIPAAVIQDAINATLNGFGVIDYL